MTSITSVELNYLVFRYLQESGFAHSAFALGYEAGISKSPIDGNLVPPGALVTFVQKGLQYLEMEANLSNSDTDLEEDFSFIQPVDLITKDVYQLRQMIKEKRRILQKDKDKDKEIDKEHEEERGRVREKERHEREKEQEKDRERTEKDKQQEKQHEEHNERDMVTDQEDRINATHEGNGVSGVKHEGPEPMDISTNSSSQAYQIPSSDTLVLEGHTSEVCACAWSPTGSLLASGSGDSTARIWTISDGSSGSGMRNSLVNVLVLKHVKGRTNEKSKDVTTLDWNGEGTLLATGSYDGQARIWNTNGELRSTLSKHKGPIFSLKWNKKGDYLLTGSCDKTAIVWDVKSEECKQQFEFHKGPTLDVDWRNNVSFATSSTDSMIHVFKIGESHPIRTFSGHQGEVNCVKWDPTGSLLASCSDDISAKIWSLKHDKHVHDFREHSKEIYTIRWSPTGPGTNNPNQQLVLASASFDSTVKLWDVDSGNLLCTLNGHRVKEARIWNTNGESKSTLTEHRGSIDPVKWNKKGDYILTGSHDKTAIVWDVKSEECKQQFKFHTGQILDADWCDNVSLATSFTDGMIHVFKIGESHPISTFSGHQDKVNCVKWDPTGLLLASCSDDSLF